MKGRVLRMLSMFLAGFCSLDLLDNPRRATTKGHEELLSIQAVICRRSNRTLSPQAQVPRKLR
jgi:hypothetical protein